MNKEIIKTLLPFGSAILIFLGFYNLQCYYWWFDINIYNYVDTGELILLFTSIIFQLLFLGVTFILYFYLTSLWHKLSYLDKRQRHVLQDGLIKHKHPRKIDFFDKLWLFALSFISFFMYIIGVLLIVFLLMVFLIVILVQVDNDKVIMDNLKDNWKLFILIFFSWVGMKLLSQNLFKNRKIFFLRNSFKFWFYEKFSMKLSKTFVVSYKIFFYLLLFFWVTNRFKAFHVLSKKGRTDITFIYNNQTFSTNDSTVFVGETKDYIFFRNTKTSANLIFERSRIMSLTLKVN